MLLAIKKCYSQEIPKQRHRNDLVVGCCWWFDEPQATWSLRDRLNLKMQIYRCNTRLFRLNDVFFLLHRDSCREIWWESEAFLDFVLCCVECIAGECRHVFALFLFVICNSCSWSFWKHGWETDGFEITNWVLLKVLNGKNSWMVRVT